MGMAEIAAWAELWLEPLAGSMCANLPILDQMWACASNEFERQAIRTAMFGSADRHRSIAFSLTP